MDIFLEFTTALSSNTTGLGQGVLDFVSGGFEALTDLFASSSKADAAPEPDSIPLIPLEPATPIEATPEV